MHNGWGPRWVWLAVGWLLGLSVFTPWRGEGQTLPAPEPVEGPAAVYLPLVAMAPAPSLDWDPRLDRRGAYLIPAAPAGWRLVRARWLDADESGGRHHIYIDTLDADGQRVTGVPVRIEWDGGEATITTEAKPGEPYAANFPMYAVAPAYSAQPRLGGNRGDLVGGMGLGSIEQPAYAIHTSYELVWQFLPSDDYAR